MQISCSSHLRIHDLHILSCEKVKLSKIDHFYTDLYSQVILILLM